MWSSRLFWKALLLAVGLNSLLGAVLLIALPRWFDAQMRRQVRDDLEATARVVDDLLTAAQRAGMTGDSLVRSVQVDGLEVSLVSTDGRVLADSPVAGPADEAGSISPERLPQDLVDASVDGLGFWQDESVVGPAPRFFVALKRTSSDGRSDTVRYIRVGAAADRFEAQVLAARRLSVMLALLLVALAGILTGAMAVVVQFPLRQLIREVRRAIEGRGWSPSVFDRRDEVGMLAAELDELQGRSHERERLLREEGNRLAAVLAGMAEGVLVVDSQLRVLLANEASRRMLGLLSHDPTGHRLGESGVHPAIVQAVEATLRTGQPTQEELDLTGTPRKVFALRAVRLPGRPSLGAMVVIRDLSEVKSLENLRREFVANVSHELKTPLSSIKAYAETLRLGAMSDPQHNLTFVARIEEQAERLHELISDLLSLARVESGRLALEVTDVAVASLVTTCIAQYSQAASAKTIRLEYTPPKESLFVRADEEGVRTILNNLVDNAIKYTPSGGTVSIRWWRDGRHGILEVEDTGIGIGPSDQARVFERFYRADKARSRQLGGTGLGLAIVKHMSHALGGSVELRSEVGRGSTFRVLLPAAAGPRPSLDVAAEEAAGQDRTSSPPAARVPAAGSS
jgi:two-component system phosphate regulon sensor histidine kinase PhoR